MADPMREHFRHGNDVDWERLAQRQREWLALADAWWALASARPGARVADVGCGPGVFAARYAQLGADVTAVDLHEEALARIPRTPRLRTVAHDAARAPLPGSPYEVLFLTDVLHHAQAPGALLRGLRASGRALLVGELDPEGPGDVGPEPSERLPPHETLALLVKAGWQPGPITRQPFEHYAVVAR